jgi:hypothetical protein
MKTSTILIPQRADENGRVRMVDAAYKVTLDGLCYADTSAIVLALRSQQAEFHKYATEAEKTGKANGNADLVSASVSLKEAADRFEKLAAAFDVQPLIEEKTLGIGKGFYQTNI